MFEHLGILSPEKLDSTLEKYSGDDYLDDRLHIIQSVDYATGIEIDDASYAERMDAYVFLRLTRGVRWNQLMGRIMLASEGNGTFSGAYDTTFKLISMVYTSASGDEPERVTILLATGDTLGRTEGVAIVSTRDQVYVITHRRFEEWVTQLLSKDLRPMNEEKKLPDVENPTLN